MTKKQLMQKIEDLEAESRTFNGAIQAHQDRISDHETTIGVQVTALNNLREDNAILITLTGTLTFELEKLKVGV